jgi:hypothetical protein
MAISSGMTSFRGLFELFWGYVAGDKDDKQTKGAK